MLTKQERAAKMNSERRTDIEARAKKLWTGSEGNEVTGTEMACSSEEESVASSSSSSSSVQRQMQTDAHTLPVMQSTRGGIDYSKDIIETKSAELAKKADQTREGHMEKQAREQEGQKEPSTSDGQPNMMSTTNFKGLGSIADGQAGNDSDSFKGGRISSFNFSNSGGSMAAVDRELAQVDLNRMATASAAGGVDLEQSIDLHDDGLVHGRIDSFSLSYDKEEHGAMHSEVERAAILAATEEANTRLSDEGESPLFTSGQILVGDDEKEAALWQSQQMSTAILKAAEEQEDSSVDL
jgi:hypothetical protein